MRRLGLILRYLIIGCGGLLILFVVGFLYFEEVRVLFAGHLASFPVVVQFKGDLPKPQRESLIEGFQLAASMTLPPKAMLEGICRRTPWCEGLDYDIKFIPKQLVLGVSVAIPEFVIESGGERWLVSTGGELIQTVSSIQDTTIAMTAADLPLIQLGMADLPHGLVSSVSSCARAINSAAPSDMRFEQFVAISVNDVRAISSGSEVPPLLIDCSHKDQLGIRIKRAQSVARDLKSRGEVSQYLDLRTENQVIVK
jgi:hypothetical protein